MREWTERFTAVVERELRAVLRSRSVWVLAVGFFALTLAAGLFSGRSGYVPLVLALLTPVEVLAPVLVVALGYRAVLGDRLRGELAVFETFPLSPLAYGLGVYCGRLAVALGVVFVTLVATALVVPAFNPSPAALTRTTGLDSPVYYARFVALTLVFVGVVMAVTVLVSSVARTARRGLVWGVALLLLLVVGFDLAIVAGVGQHWITERGLGVALAASPLSAYRGLVMTYAVGPAVTMPVRAAAPVASVASLLVWTALSLLAAAGLTGIE
ncbi:MAG: ABC transporter permease [Halobacterium sp.]